MRLIEFFHISCVLAALAMTFSGSALALHCDVNGDGTVDIGDINAIALKIDQPAASPDDPMDYDDNGEITAEDESGCQRLCTVAPCDPDGDLDGIADSEDNCPAAANPDQEDLDGDSQGDLCDDDRDGDGVNNDVDAFPDNPAAPSNSDEPGDDLDPSMGENGSDHEEPVGSEP